MKFVKADIFVVSQRQEQFGFDSPNVQLSRSAEAFFDKFKRRDWLQLRLFEVIWCFVSVPPFIFSG